MVTPKVKYEGVGEHRRTRHHGVRTSRSHRVKRAEHRAKRPTTRKARRK